MVIISASTLLAGIPITVKMLITAIITIVLFGQLIHATTNTLVTYAVVVTFLTANLFGWLFCGSVLQFVSLSAFVLELLLNRKGEELCTLNWLTIRLNTWALTWTLVCHSLLILSFMVNQEEMLSHLNLVWSGSSSQWCKLILRLACILCSSNPWHNSLWCRPNLCKLSLTTPLCLSRTCLNNSR